jgi:hypothetical protein
MKLEKREKMLLYTTGGLVLLIGAYFLLFAGDSRSTDELTTKREQLAKELKEQHNYLDIGKRDRKRQADWHKRSLPTNIVIGRAAYQNWLLALAGKSHLAGPKISSSETVSHREQYQYTKLGFTLKAEASLGDIVDFMYGFYSAGYLHEIRNLDVKPIRGSRSLDFTVLIEVVALPGADSKDKLPTEPGNVLRMKYLADYRTPITTRNLFAPYVPPTYRPPEPPGPGPSPPIATVVTIDPASRAFVTGFTEVDGTPEVWLMDRVAGKSWTLRVGETFRVGKLSGVVQSIDPEGEAVIQYGGKTKAFHDGETLLGGATVKASGTSVPAPDKLSTTKPEAGE